MDTRLTRVVALGAFALLCGGGTEALAAGAKLNTANFVAACAADQIVIEDPGFEGSKVTPQAYCECVAGKLVENKLSQTDVDMLTKMHKEEISDEDAESYPTLEDLMVANEGYEDGCKQSLGLPTGEDSYEESPMEEDAMPEDEAPSDQGEVPAEEGEAPPPE
jgi:hypothetical protein